LAIRYLYFISVGFRVLIQRITEFVDATEALHFRRLFDHQDEEWQKSMEQEKSDSTKYSFINMESLNPVFYLTGSSLALSLFIFILEIVVWANKGELFNFPLAVPKDYGDVIRVRLNLFSTRALQILKRLSNTIISFANIMKFYSSRLCTLQDIDLC